MDADFMLVYPSQSVIVEDSQTDLFDQQNLHCNVKPGSDVCSCLHSYEFEIFWDFGFNALQLLVVNNPVSDVPGNFLDWQTRSKI